LKEYVEVASKVLGQSPEVVLQQYYDRSEFTWVPHSQWEEVAPGKYQRFTRPTEELMKMDTRFLMTEAQRENPEWFKFHAIPNLLANRMDRDPEHFIKRVIWWLQWTPVLKPYLLAYAKKCIDDWEHQKDQPKLGPINLINYASHALTNFCRKVNYRPAHPEQTEYTRLLTAKGYSITRADGWDDYSWFIVTNPLLADYAHEPVLFATAILAAGKERVVTRIVQEFSPALNRNVTRLLVRAHQGHSIERAAGLFQNSDFWHPFPHNAQHTLVLHGTSIKSARLIMQPGGTMKCKTDRAHLHFAFGGNTDTLAAIKQLKEEKAYLVMNGAALQNDFQLYSNEVNTLTICRDGIPVREIPNRYIRFVMNNYGQQLHSGEVDQYGRKTVLGERPPPELQTFIANAGRDNYPASRVVIDGMFMDAITSLRKGEDNALDIILRNSQEFWIRQRQQDGGMDRQTGTVRDRIQSNRPWMLNPEEKDLTFTEAQYDVTTLALNPESQCLSGQLLERAARSLATERSPLPKHSESTVMGWINDSGNEAYIACPNAAQAQQPSAETVFENLPGDSIVRHMTREYHGMIRLWANRDWSIDQDEEKAKTLYGHSIVRFFLRNRINPATPLPAKRNGKYQTGPKPDLHEFALRTFRLLQPNSPANMHFMELNHTLQSQCVESYADAVHQWAVQENQYVLTTRKSVCAYHETHTDTCTSRSSGASSHGYWRGNCFLREHQGSGRQIQ
jgi:hypothetical protein